MSMTRVWRSLPSYEVRHSNDYTFNLYEHKPSRITGITVMHCFYRTSGRAVQSTPTVRTLCNGSGHLFARKHINVTLKWCCTFGRLTVHSYSRVSVKTVQTWIYLYTKPLTLPQTGQLRQALFTTWDTRA